MDSGQWALGITAGYEHGRWNQRQRLAAGVRRMAESLLGQFKSIGTRVDVTGRNGTDSD